MAAHWTIDMTAFAGDRTCSEVSIKCRPPLAPTQLSISSTSEPISLSSPVSARSLPAVASPPSEESPLAEESSVAEDSVEVCGLKQLLKEKTQACDTLRLMLFRSEHCHQVTICGLSKCISNQGQILAQNQAEMEKLNAKFARDAVFIQAALAQESAHVKALDVSC